MSAGDAGKKAAGTGTDAALVQQMQVVKSILDKAPLDLKNLSNQCLILSKIVDSLVALSLRPNHRHDLLPLVQQVCKYKDKPEARPALLVLLLSIKSAFRADWLSALEVAGNDEIFTTLNLLFNSFTTSHKDSVESSLQSLQCGGSAVRESPESLNYLISINNRFYPRLLLNAVFVSVQAKAGYEVLMCDFHVPHMQIQDRVRLYVGKADSIETSTCIITPPQVNILVNGQQVEKRVTTAYLDLGPQMPSDVSGMVKVGANVLQVIGEFSEPYVIAVTSTRTTERSAKNTHLEDYVAPTKAASREVDPTEVDDEVVEGASRLSLRCPISHRRLVTPVKGTTCRHLQCFDYDNFLEINEKRPAWRCPCCNYFISWPDLRIDRQMEKVLKETDEKIYEVIISQDGCWVPVSTGEIQSNSGPHVIPVEGCEVGSEVIDLSHMAEGELNGIGQNSNEEIRLPERKPDKQTLQAITENRGNPSQGTNPMVRQQDTVEQLRVINIPDITAIAPQTSHNFTRPSWVRLNPNGSLALNVTGDVPPASGSAEMLIHSQPAPLAEAPPTANHNSQGNYSQSRTGPVNGYRTSMQLQQQHIGIPSNTGFVTRNETEWVWQRGQQSPGISPQNNQHLGQTQQQWRGPGVHPHQLVTNTAQIQSLHITQQFYNHDSSHIPVPHSLHQTADPGINLQQTYGAWGGPPAEQWPPSSGTATQVPGGPTTLEGNWRPASIRMRGSIANPSLARGVLEPTPHALLQRSGFNTGSQHSESVPHGINRPQVNAGQFHGRMPTPGNLQTRPPFQRGPRG